MNSRIVIGLGELLWDMFPAGKKLGGAPANFAYISSLLRDSGVVASRVGQDDLGRQAISCVKALGGGTGEIQTDSIHPTGTVEVSIDNDGQAKFEMHGIFWSGLRNGARWRNAATQYALVLLRSDLRSPAKRSSLFFRRRSSPQCASLT